QPIINPDSNGVFGNNQEIGVTYNGNMSALLDNNPDTWFEYENVVKTESPDPLILDLTLNLGDAAILNHIRIIPNNFGTKSIVKIEEIETSLDGEFWISIKDEIE